MEDLRQSVTLRSYGQRDPLQEYKGEAYSFFEQMMNTVRAQISSSIFRSATSVQAFQSLIQMLRKARQTGPGEGDLSAEAKPVAKSESPEASGEAKSGVSLPKVSTAPPYNTNEPERNDTVVIRRGKETQEMKYKKAKTLIDNEGWVLVKVVK
jgi:preprotein translocase subunit SecA